MHDVSLPVLVIVSGVPGTGKTTLGWLLRNRLGWPLLTRDRIKEAIHDASDLDIESLTRERSHIYGQQSDALMHATARELLAAGVSCIIESNFIPERAAYSLAPLTALARARQLHCTVPAEVSIARYRARFEAGLRHPVHRDRAEADLRTADPIPDADLQPVPLDIPLLSVNTENGYVPAFDTIVAFCRAERP
jgi:predicted kinase